MTMAARRFSPLQQRLLAWLAVDERCTGGVLSSRPQDLVVALQGDKGNISHSLRTLEVRGLLVIGRSHGGKAESLYLTSEGQKWAHHFTGSCAEGL
jgi:DNA-binding MarR family transcriptional regulator